MTLDGIGIRRATAADQEIIAHHRVSMFRDMRTVKPEAVEAIRAATLEVLPGMFARDEYLGWLAVPDAEPHRVVAGVGVHRRTVLPLPSKHDGGAHALRGRQALVVNVYTEPEYRRRGLARRLMDATMDWARSSEIELVVLHASPDGRSLYESMGFVDTNEMRYAGDLRASPGAAR